MMTAIILFIILSLLASLIVVAACIKSSKVTQWENLPETYEDVADATSEPDRLPSVISFHT